MKTQHTPGPWFHGDTGQIWSNEHRIGVAYLTDYAKRLPQEANAKLIAAAPEMLDALKALMHAYASREFHVLMEARERAKELIAKLTAE